MPAPGGTTTQSGVLYQDSIAALYLARLCDPAERPTSERVREVRVEAPGTVDDILVTFGDGRREWMHVKERVQIGSREWSKLWRDFEEKRFEPDRHDGDRLRLWIGEWPRRCDAIIEAARRAAHARDADGWWDDLSFEQRREVESLIEQMSMARRTREVIHLVLSVLDIELVSQERVVRDWVPRWIPQCRGADQRSLFEILCTKAQQGARYRRTFDARGLLGELRMQQIEIQGVAAGITQYRATLKGLTDNISVPGTSLSASIRDVFHWPRLRVADPSAKRRIVDDDFIEEVGEPVDPRSLPDGGGSRTVIVGGAGSGKSTLLVAIANENADRDGWLPAIVRLADLAESGLSIVGFLNEVVNGDFGVAIDWTEECESGAVLVLFDGLDELPPADRSRVLESIKLFGTRFPRAPWILTVRDAASLASPTGARVLEVQFLEPTDIEPFCTKWLRQSNVEAARRIARSVAVSRDLRRMARVPLLLALMAEHARGGTSALPTRRGELLERYLDTVLQPAAHKPSLVDVDPARLRAASERLAFAILDAGGVDLNAGDAQRVLQGSPDGTTAALIAAGVVRVHRGALSFVLPLIQEYLAGCFVAANERESLVRRVATPLSRPWSQALHFAIEGSKDADVILTEVLALEDDAFGTCLKFVGRCIANGADVSAQMRKGVGDRLAECWMAEGTAAHHTGELLADGFVKPIPEAALARLRSGEQLEYGGAALIVAAEDPELTAQALAALIARGIAHVREWQPAIDRIAARAAEIYLENARDTSRPNAERHQHWLAYLMGELPAVSPGPDPRRDAAVDVRLPPLLRLAARIKLEPPLTHEDEAVVEAALRRYWQYEGPNSAPAFELVCDALFKLPSGAAKWRDYLRMVERAPLEARPGAWWLFGTSPSEAYWRTLFFAVATRVENARARELVRDVIASEPLSAGQRDWADLTLAFLGNRQASESLSDRLARLGHRDITSWLLLIDRFPPDIVARGIGQLSDVRKEVRHEIHSILTFALEYETESVGLAGGGRGRARRRHVAAGIGAALLLQWAGEESRESPERLEYLTGALRLGERELATAVLAGVRGVLLSDRPLPPDQRPGTMDGVHRVSLRYRIEAALGNALRALADTRVPIPLELLERAASLGELNLANAAYQQLQATGTMEALDVMLGAHAKARAGMKATCQLYVERLAQVVGARICRDDDGILRRVG